MDILGFLLTLLLPWLEKIILWFLGIKGDASQITTFARTLMGTVLTRFKKIEAACGQYGIVATPDPEGDTAEAQFKKTGVWPQ